MDGALLTGIIQWLCCAGQRTAGLIKWWDYAALFEWTNQMGIINLANQFSYRDFMGSD